MRIGLLLLVPLTACSFLSHVRPAYEERSEPHRSPIALALLPGGRPALSANHTSDSVSLVDLEKGTVLHELHVGKRPSGIACSPDGKLAAVSLLDDNAVALLEVQSTSLRKTATIPVGSRPRGVVFASQEILFVCVSATDEVLKIEVPGGKIIARLPAPREPFGLALSANGRTLAVACARSGEVRLWDAKTAKLLCVRAVPAALNLRAVTFTATGKTVVAAHAMRRGLPISNNNIESGWVLGNRLSKHSLDAKLPVEQVSLDPRSQAVGDAHGLAFDDSGKLLAVSASGSQELLIYQHNEFRWVPGLSGDLLDPEMTSDEQRFRRVPLGGRPLAIVARPKSQEVVIANYLLDALQIVDIGKGKLVGTVSLGGPKETSLVRRGEALFYDAKRSRHQWFSCHTCHPDGHTSGQTFDTFNDESEGNPKLTPSLRGVASTAPYTWHGKHKTLEDAVDTSFVDTMRGKELKPIEIKAVVAFLKTLEHPPSPHLTSKGELSSVAKRGKVHFEGKARCSRCHAAPEYTTPRNYDVKLESDGSPFDTWNPPSLRGLWDRGPYLHDGRAKTLEDLLINAHAPEKFGGTKLSTKERMELIAYLLSL